MFSYFMGSSHVCCYLFLVYSKMRAAFYTMTLRSDIYIYMCVCVCVSITITIISNITDYCPALVSHNVINLT